MNQKSGKKLLGFLLSLALVLGLMSGMSMTAFAEAASYIDDDGETYIPIRSTEELKKIGNDSDYPLSGKYILACDLAMNEMIPENFTGIFDGNGYTINLNITGGDWSTGLFRTVSGGGIVKNLITTGSVTKTGYGQVGAIAGAIGNGAVISQCWNQATVTGGSEGCSGIAGFGGEATIENCLNTGRIGSNLSNPRVGGIVCVNSGCTFTVNNCFSTNFTDNNTRAYYLVGGEYAGRVTVKNSYYYAYTDNGDSASTKSGSARNAGESVTADNVKTASTYLGWDVDAPGSVWKMGSRYPELNLSHKYLLAYDANGGSGTMEKPNTIHPSEALITAPENVYTAPDGKVFAGWNTAVDATGTSYQAGDSFIISANTTLYAHWTEIPATAPTITSVTGAALTYGYTEGSVNVNATAAEGHTITGYQWYENGTTNSNSGGTAISEATGASYTIPTGKNAGTYYYYCVVTATRTDNDQTSAATSDVATATIGKADITPAVTLSGWTYGGIANTPSVSGNMGNGGVTYTYAAKDSEAFSTDVPTEAGDYTVKATIAETTNYNGGEATAEFTIAKADSSATAPTGLELTYNGADQTLIEAGSADGGEMQYALGTDDGTIPTEGWSADIPSAEDAGTYYIWYKVVGDENHNDYGPYSVAATILKDDVEPEVSKDALTYDGTEQALIKAGEVEGGEMQYAIGTDDTTAPADGWDASVPAAKDAGSYYVWYYVKGDNNHNDTTPAALEVEIAPKPLVVTIDAQRKTYGDADPELTYKAEGLVDGDSLNVTLKRDAGENVGSYRISAEAAESNYALAFREAALTIEARDITITAADQTVIDGDAIQTGVDKVKLSGQATGDTLSTVTLTSDAGRGTITPSAAKIVNAEGKDVTGNYNITYAVGALTVNQKPTEPTPAPTPAETEMPAEQGHLLLAKLSASGKKALKLTWTTVPGAEGYDLYFAACGQSFEKVGSVGGSSTRSYTVKGLDKYGLYKGYVVAWKTVNGARTTLGKSPTVHAITGGYTNKYTNPKKVTVKKSAVKLSVGKSARINAGVKKVKNSRKLVNHASKLRYYSSDTAVATVSASGKITAVGAGSCTVYAVAVNGARASVKVTVK